MSPSTSPAITPTPSPAPTTRLTTSTPPRNPLSPSPYPISTHNPSALPPVLRTDPRSLASNPPTLSSNPPASPSQSISSSSCTREPTTPGATLPVHLLVLHLVRLPGFTTSAIHANSPTPSILTTLPSCRPAF